MNNTTEPSEFNKLFAAFKLISKVEDMQDSWQYLVKFKNNHWCCMWWKNGRLETSEGDGEFTDCQLVYEIEKVAR